MKNIGFILLVLSCISCNKEKQTFSDLYIENATGHKIELLPYKMSNVYLPGKIVVVSGENKKIDSYFSRGISNTPVVFPAYLDMTDSLRVIFDDVYSITHYFVTPAALARKYYLKNSKRNLGSLANYEQTISADSKHTRKWIVQYRFTEQDYLDAKN